MYVRSWLGSAPLLDEWHFLHSHKRWNLKIFILNPGIAYHDLLHSEKPKIWQLMEKMITQNNQTQLGHRRHIIIRVISLLVITDAAWEVIVVDYWRFSPPCHYACVASFHAQIFVFRRKIPSWSKFLLQVSIDKGRDSIVCGMFSACLNSDTHCTIPFFPIYSSD